MHWLSWEPLCEPIFLCISVFRVASGPRVKLASCKSALNLLPPPPPPPPPTVVCSTDRSKAVVPLLVLLFVALLYVFPCVILFLCFSVLLVLRLPRLGKRELILVLFVRLFGLCLFRFVGFHFFLGSGKGCGLWLWHSLDFSLTFFKNFLVSNRSNSFNTTLQKCFFGDPLPKLFKPSWFVKKHGRKGAGLIFPIYLYRKLKKIFS